MFHIPKKHIVIMLASAIIIMLLLSACGSKEYAPKIEEVQETETPVSTPEPTPTPTPAPTPTPTPPVDVDENGNFTIYGKTFNIEDEEINLSHISVDDNGALAAGMLPCMPNVKTLDMDSCGVSNEEMAKIRDANPNVEVIWRVDFGTNYTARTNVVKILASMPSQGGMLTDDVGEQLKYCTNVRYLDLGHNEELSDFSFVECMTKLEIAVISDTAVSDLSPFAKCENLQYLEAGNCKLSDLSPLAKCKNLLHLNVGTNAEVTDISPLYDLDLLRLWIGSYDPVPEEQVAKMKELHPNCIIDTTVPSGLEKNPDGTAANEGFVMHGWKDYMQWMAADWEYYRNYGCMPAATPKGYYKGIYTAFEYDKAGYAYAFIWNDPLYSWYNPDAEEIGMQIVDWKAIGEESLIEDDWTWEEKYGTGVEKTNEEILAERAEKAAQEATKETTQNA